MIDFIGELCTFDSAFVRGWRWLGSSKYRSRIRAECARRHPFLVMLGVLETLLLMTAEVVLVVTLLNWLLTE